MEERFLADSMLGKLAKWLRIMGYDTHYQSYYGESVLQYFVLEGRVLLSRHRKTVQKYPNSQLILSDHVKDQLQEMRDRGRLTQGREWWFSRCLRCNAPLTKAKAEDARENVPEYVFFQDPIRIRFCPSCGRYFWLGSHRESMRRQLEEWGF